MLHIKFTQRVPYTTAVNTLNFGFTPLELFFESTKNFCDDQ